MPVPALKKRTSQIDLTGPLFGLEGKQRRSGAHFRAHAIAGDYCEAEPHFLPGSEGFAGAQATDLPLQVPVPVGALPDLDPALPLACSILRLHTFRL